MYAPFFGLSQDPFSIAPDPHYLFMSGRHREALAHLLYGLDGGGGFVVLTGEIGTGKTTVCRCFLEQVPAHCNVAYIVNPRLTATELVQTVCEDFGVVAPGTAAGGETVRHWTGLLNQFLLQAHAAGRNCVLIIDEAQQLSAEVLEQLRLLTNLETNERKLLQIVLIGQPELRDMLARPELEQLAQRVIARFHLDALSAEESTQYITHRLAVAGWSGPLPFDRAALRDIHRLARGVPRRINLLCGRALLGAYASGQRVVGRATVARAAREVFGGHPTPRPPQRHKAAWWGGLAGATAVGVLGAVTWVSAGRPGWNAEPVAAASPVAAQPAPAASSPIGAISGPQQAASAAVPAVAASPATTTAPILPTLDASSLTAAWPSLPRDESSAWQALGTLWGAPADESGDPCKAWAARDLQCFKAQRTSLAMLRQLDRPGLLTLVSPEGRSAYAVLTGLNADYATLELNGVPHRVRVDTLAQWWRGDFATLWRSPPGYPGARQAVNSPVVAEWLVARLDSLPTAAPAASAREGAPDLKARLYQFQLAQGLIPDGRAGPMTFMQLNRAAGLAEPRLRSATDTPASAGK